MIPRILIKNTDKNTRLINLNTQKTDIKLSGDVRIKFIRRDLIVTQHHVKKMFFSCKENYTLRFSDTRICTIPFLRRVQNIKTVSHFLTIY